MRVKPTAALNDTVAKPAPRSGPPSLVRKTSWSALASLTSTAAGAASNVVIARLLGPGGTGDIAYAMWVITTVGTVAGVGIPQVLARYLAELDGGGQGNAMAGVARWVLRRGLVALGSGVAIVVALPLATNAVRSPGMLLAIVAAYVGQSTVTLYTAVLAGFQDYRRTARLNFTAAIVQLLGVSLGAAWAGSAGALVGYAAGALVPATLCIRFAAGHAVRPSEAMSRRMRQFAFDSWIALTVSIVLWTRSEVFFLERTWGKASVGMFTVGLTLGQLATQGPLLVGTALMPHFAQLVGAGDSARLARTYSTLLKLMTFMTVPLCLGLAVASPVVVPIVFGSRFSAAAAPASVLVAFAAVGAVATVSSSATYALERARFIAFAGGIGAAVGALAYAVVIPRAGPLGAAVTRAVLHVAMVAWGMAYLARRAELRVPIAALFRICCVSIVAVLPILAGVLSGRIALVLVGVAIAALLYITGIRVTRALSAVDLAPLSRAIADVPWPGAKRAAGWLAYMHGDRVQHGCES